MGLRFLRPFFCLSVSPHNILKIDAARITKLDKEMFTMSTANPFIMGFEGQR